MNKELIPIPSTLSTAKKAGYDVYIDNNTGVITVSFTRKKRILKIKNIQKVLNK